MARRKKMEEISDGLSVISSAGMRKRDVSNPLNSTFLIDTIGTSNYQLFEGMYLSTWIGKKIVEIPTQSAFKNGFNFKIPTDPEVEEQVLKYYHEHKLQALMMEGSMDADIYGGAVIYINNPKADPLQPFDPAYCAINPEQVEFVEYDASYLAVTPHINPGKRSYNSPNMIAAFGATFEQSHGLIFQGVNVMTRWKPRFKYLGMSIFQNIFQTILNDEVISKAIPNLVHRCSIYFYKVAGLQELVKQGKEDKIMNKISKYEDLKSIYSAGVIDLEDEVQIVAQTFAGLPDLDRRSVERLAAASGIPATVLLGKSPDGQNSTGDSDLENFYNFIELYQEKLTPNMNKLFDTLIWMVAGRKIEFEFKFEKPQQISKVRRLDTDQKTLINAATMQTLGLPDSILKRYLVDNGVIETDEAEEMDENGEELQRLAPGGEQGGEGEPEPAPEGTGEEIKIPPYPKDQGMFEKIKNMAIKWIK